ncbi:hypothetical protein [Olleya aquimaris]|uniref:Uncharacterized protein n=1 Tax=Olleya aquimaris TaxID=639310 RepID=A0A327RI72_9FLAO|nr:hypothetical protein [Olleya aquimaris]RAJ15193.1 hypothetical protein LY08_01546 [Olleya aquimaris]
MKKLILFSLVAILATSCNGQDNDTLKQDFAKTETPQDTVKPKVSWKVNKEVDENGNVIRYDSIYSWSSSSGNLKSFNSMEVDSIYSAMQSRMKQHFSNFGFSEFSSFKDQDSIMNQFFSDSFFSNKMTTDFPDIESIRQRMEAMQQQFFNQQRAIIPKIEEKENDRDKKRI